MLPELDPDQVRLAEWFAYLERKRLPNEELMGCSNRLIVRHALLTTPSRKAAAAMLSVDRGSIRATSCAMFRYCQRYAPEFLGKRRLP